MPDLNPFDDIIDAIKGLLTAGSVENYVADKTSIGGAKNEAAMDAYKTIRNVANYGTTAADIAYTGGVVKPAAKLLLAQNMIASKEEKAKAIKEAKKEFALAAGTAAAGLGAGKAVQKGIEALAKRRVLQELDSILGVHHSWTPGIKQVNPSTIPTGTMGATAGDQVPGYTYIWLGEHPVAGVDKASGLPWEEIRRMYYSSPNQRAAIVKLLKSGAQPQMTPEGFYPAVNPWQETILAEVPFQYKHQIDRWMDDPRYAKGFSYIVKAPGKKVELDENLFTQPIFGQGQVNLFDQGILGTGARVKGPVQVIDEVPTGELNNVQYPYGVDVNELFDRFVQAILNQRQIPIDIAETAGRRVAAVDRATVPATKLAQLARLMAQNER